MIHWPKVKKVLAVDPGKSAGWATFINGNFHKSGRMNGDNVINIERVIDKERPDLMVIENQVMNPKARFDAVRTLIRRATMWEVLIELRCKPFVRVFPQSWQSWAGVKKGAKGAIKIIANSVADHEVLDDEADAILMGMWAVTVKPSE